MVKLEEAALVAPAFGADERTAACVSLPNSPFHRRRDMTRVHY
jgi:hypothetical protein